MKTILSILIAVAGLSAQTTAVPAAVPELQFLNGSGVPLVGAYLCSFAGGTTTPLATYTDSTGGTANSNPIVLDVNGRASVWLTPGTLYKFVLYVGGSNACPSSGAVQWTQDNVSQASVLGPASSGTLGGVKCGTGTNCAVDGTITVTPSTINFTAPSTGGTAVALQGFLQGTAVSVLDYGAYCDGSHDDTPALQHFFNVLGVFGIAEGRLPTQGQPNAFGGTSTGVCLFSSQLTIGNGSSSNFSSNNGFRLIGAGGSQQAAASNTNVTLNAGTSVLKYIGSTLTSTAAVFVQGPIYSITLKGFTVDCNNKCSTGLLMESPVNSKVDDVYVVDNKSDGTYTDAGIIISAWCGIGTGAQGNIFENMGVISSYSGFTGFRVGALSTTHGTSCTGLDVSGNEFIDMKIQGFNAYSTGTIGLVLAYADANEWIGGGNQGSTDTGISIYYVLTGGYYFPLNNTMYRTGWQTDGTAAATGTYYAVNANSGPGFAANARQAPSITFIPWENECGAGPNGSSETPGLPGTCINGSGYSSFIYGQSRIAPAANTVWGTTQYGVPFTMPNVAGGAATSNPFQQIGYCGSVGGNGSYQNLVGCGGNPGDNRQFIYPIQMSMVGADIEFQGEALWTNGSGIDAQAQFALVPGNANSFSVTAGQVGNDSFSTGTSTVTVGRMIFDIHTVFYGIGSSGYVTQWGTTTWYRPGSGAAVVLPIFAVYAVDTTAVQQFQPQIKMTNSSGYFQLQSMRTEIHYPNLVY